MYETKLALYIDGVWHTESRDSQTVVNPATEEALAQLPHAASEDLNRALMAAQKAFEKWRDVSPWEREKVLKRAAQLIGDRKESAGDDP